MLNHRRRSTGRACRALAVVSGIIIIAAVFVTNLRTRDPISKNAAVSAIVVDAESGEVLYERRSEQRIPPASLTKLMTVLLAVEAVEHGQLSMLDPVRVSEHAASVEGSRVWLEAGEYYSFEQLLESAMIASANDSAVAVAEHLAGSEPRFVDEMMEKASELGMTNTRFVNATGLPSTSGGSDGYTTASDMACLAREALRHQEILKWSSTRSKVFMEHPLFVMNNTNPLLGTYPGCDGLKTGYTKAAGYHLIATARVDGVRLIAIIMHAESNDARAAGCARLLDYGFWNTVYGEHSTLTFSDRVRILTTDIVRRTLK
jgi:D-alanyl-D-alanine carboxypeptidase (penicillin-binding protein 5/6)